MGPRVEVRLPVQLSGTSCFTSLRCCFTSACVSLPLVSPSVCCLCQANRLSNFTRRPRIRWGTGYNAGCDTPCRKLAPVFPRRCVASCAPMSFHVGHQRGHSLRQGLSQAVPPRLSTVPFGENVYVGLFDLACLQV